MMNCSVCSKRNALTYDEKSKKFFCESHSNKDLAPKNNDLVKLSKKSNSIVYKVKTAIKKLKKK